MRIGLDVGGTKIRAGLVDGGAVLESVTMPCPSMGTKMEVVEAIFSLIDSMLCHDIDMIGIGVPAVVDEDGVVLDCVNIPSWDRVELRKIVGQRYGLPVQVNNDCNCFSLGVLDSDLGRGFSNMVCLTLGTGLGAGIIINGRPYNGKNCGAGEIGYLPYGDSDFEQHCSSQFFKHLGKDGYAEFLAARSGDEGAIALWNEFGENLGDLLKTIAFTYAPDAIVIGGSIAGAHEFFEAAMLRRFATFPFPGVTEDMKVLFATSGDYLITGSLTQTL